MAERLAPDQFVGERIGGRFVIERLIGAGPLSSAFRARDELLHRRVTVKLFHPQHADDATVVDVQLELAKAVARLSHPNIVTVIDRGEHEGLPFIVLEYVRGENLQERIDRFAPLSTAEVAALGSSIARALAYSHGQGVAHGNLRPGNVLISEEREVKLVDFGGGSFVASLTGADAYAPPELRSSQPGSAGSGQGDIYALGVLLFVALTEQEPQPGTDAGHVQLLRPDVSPRLASIISRAIAASPEDRFESMHELASEISALRVVANHGASNGAAASGPPARGAGAPDDPDATGLMPVAQQSAASRAAASPVADTARTARRERPERVPSPRQARARAVAWSMVLVPMLALVLVGVMIAGERGTPTVKSKNRGPGGVPAPLHVASAASFDPSGDTVEHPDEVAFLTDKDPETTWQTEGYEGSPELTTYKQGEDKGVGFYLTLDDPSTVTSMRFATDLLGWTAQIYGADLPGERLGDWEPISKAERIATDGTEVVVDTGGHAYTSYLVWVSRLSVDGDGMYRARVAEVQVLGVAGR